MTVHELRTILSKVDGESEIHLYSFGEAVEVKATVESGIVVLSSIETIEDKYRMFD